MSGDGSVVSIVGSGSSIKRVASAVGEGAMAIALLHTYLRELDDAAGVAVSASPGHAASA